MGKKDFFFWLVKPVQEVVPSDFLPISTAHGRQHSYGEVSKAALWEQAYHQCTLVSWGVAQVMAVRCRKGQLLALLRGQGRWYPVESVTISRPRQCPTGACDIEGASK